MITKKEVIEGYNNAIKGIREAELSKGDKRKVVRNLFESLKRITQKQLKN